MHWILYVAAIALIVVIGTLYIVLLAAPGHAPTDISDVVQQVEEKVEEEVEKVLHVHPSKLKVEEHEGFVWRLANHAKYFFGSPAFLIGFVIFSQLWAIENQWGPVRIDPFPNVLFINLISQLAIVIATLILMAQIRSERHDAARDENRWAQQKETHDNTETIKTLVEEVHRMEVLDAAYLNELRDMKERLFEHFQWEEDGRER